MRTVVSASLPDASCAGCFVATRLWSLLRIHLRPASSAAWWRSHAAGSPSSTTRHAASGIWRRAPLPAARLRGRSAAGLGNDRLAEWTVFTQAAPPSFGYKGHRSGGGHLNEGVAFSDYLQPREHSFFVDTAAFSTSDSTHFASSLRMSYMYHDALLASKEMCPPVGQWSEWWDMGWFTGYVQDKWRAQNGTSIVDFYNRFVLQPGAAAWRRCAFALGPDANDPAAAPKLSNGVLFGRPRSSFEMPSTLPEDTAAIASLGHRRAQATPKLRVFHFQPPGPAPASAARGCATCGDGATCGPCI